MREILFRGKRLENNAWVFGSFCMDAVEQKNGLCGVDGFIRLYDFAKGKMQMHEVDRETVGQFTGLLDKNGERIFEGDILRYYDDEIQVVDWNSEWSQLMLHTYGDYERKRGRKTVKEKFEGWNHLTDYPLEDMPIIGNIYDNPELLTKGD